MRTPLAMILVLAIAASVTAGAKSSLLKSGKTAPPPVINDRGEEIISTEVATVANTSLVAVKKPEPRKFSLHDHITIIVREESSSKTKADSEQSKELTVTAKIKEWMKFRRKGGNVSIMPDEGIAATTPGVNVKMKRESEGEGEATTKDSFLTKITTEIIDIKPNGNLVVEAITHVEHNDEKITLTLTGVVAPKNVSVSDTVESSSVARLTVTKKTEGIARDGQKRGWLHRLFDAITPF